MGIDLQCQRPPSLVPRRLIEEITERVDRDGQVIIPLHREEIGSILDRLMAEGVEAIAVSLLWSFKNPTHEAEIGKAIAAKHPEIYLSLSSQVAPVIGEYERTATTAMNASLGPLMKKHLDGLTQKLDSKGLPVPLLLMQSTGGVVPASDAILKPVTLVNSGPAGGVIAGKYFSELLGMPNCLCVDMGGTSFDVSLITEGQYSASLNTRVADNNIAVPMLDIFSIGAGGGSIAWLDRGKRLKVGPQSAGASPGPACYGWGGVEPAVTDADVVLGRINPAYFLGGEIALDKAKAEKAIREKIAQPLGMETVSAAWGICQLVDAAMAEAVRTMTIQKGYDPRDYALLAFGGAGPTHATAIARELGIKTIIISPLATVQSAFGIVHSDIVHSLTLGDIVGIEELEKVRHNFSELERQGKELLGKEGVPGESWEMKRFVDMHYRGQAHEVTIPVPSLPNSPQDLAGLVQAFEAKYQSLYGQGTVFSQAGYEIATFRLEARGKTRKPLTLTHPPSTTDAAPALKGTRKVFFDKGFADTRVYDGAKLQAGNILEGPAILEYLGTTVVLEPWLQAKIDPYLNLILTEKI